MQSRAVCSYLAQAAASATPVPPCPDPCKPQVRLHCWEGKEFPQGVLAVELLLGGGVSFLQHLTSVGVRWTCDQFPTAGREGVGQAIVPYCRVLSSRGISRFTKQERGNLCWLHEEGADDTAKARHSPRAAQGQCQPLAEHQHCYPVLHQLHIKHHSFAKTDHRQLQHTQNSSLTRLLYSVSTSTISAGKIGSARGKWNIYSSTKGLWMKN